MRDVDQVERQKLIGRLDVLVFSIIAALGAPPPGFGQWVRYPTADVPKKADGTPDFNAPTPRLPDGKPDFSGIWHASAINQCVPSTGQFCGLEVGGSPLALNIGQDLPGGLPYQPWAAELVKQRFSKDDPHVRCLPDNPPRTWGMPHLTKALHTPPLLVLLFEVNAMYRKSSLTDVLSPTIQTPRGTGTRSPHGTGTRS